jgi:hypothetical protein
MSVKTQETVMEIDVKRNDVNVKMDAEVARKCKIVASLRGISAAEYLSERMRPLVQKDFEADMQNELRPDRGRRPKGGEQS